MLLKSAFANRIVNALSALRRRRPLVGPNLFQTLPTELIELIFIFCIPLDTFSTPRRGQAPLNLCDVCTQWRIIVYSTPLLWTAISLDRVLKWEEPHFQVHTPNSELEIAKHWLGRSGTSTPLSLHLGIHRHKYAEDWPSDTSAWSDAGLIALLSPEYHRWTRVCVANIMPTHMYSFLSHEWLHELITSSPNLSHLTWPDHGALFEIKSTSLKHLTVSSCNTISHRLWEGVPNLRVLDLILLGTIWSNTEDTPRHRIIPPHTELRELFLTVSSQSCVLLEYLLNHLSCIFPNLSTLSIKWLSEPSASKAGHSNHFIREFKEMFLAPGGIVLPLTSLSLLGIPAHVGDITSCIDLVRDSVVDLQVGFAPGERVGRQLEDMCFKYILSPDTRFPKLRSMTLVIHSLGNVGRLEALAELPLLESLDIKVYSGMRKRSTTAMELERRMEVVEKLERGPGKGRLRVSQKCIHAT